MKSTISVVLEGRGKLVLRQSDHLATGGEGSLFRANDTIVKIYTDPRKMQRDGMTEKIRFLAKIVHPYVVAPSGIVLDEKGREPIGLFMPFVRNGEVYPRLFTNDYRARVGVADKEVSVLSARMRDAVAAAHAHKAVMVDANELNWLAVFGKKDGPEPRAIDVDSWAIGRWGAKVIMPSIRDWHAKEFTELTDWFSWGIITFQLYTGIHPYKGKCDGFSPGALEERMKANASVFRKGVRLPRAVRDFSCIPAPLFDWYVAAFEKGERSIPPSPLDAAKTAARAAQVMRIVTTATGMLVHEKLYSALPDAALRIFHCGAVLLASGRVIDLATRKDIALGVSPKGEVVAVADGWLIADEAPGGGAVFSHTDSVYFANTPLSFPLRSRGILRYENRLFAITEHGLTEIIFVSLGTPVISAGNTWGALPNATRLFDGVGVQDAMGAIYLVAPFGERGCAHIRARELDGLATVAAKAGNRFIAVVAMDKTGAYHKLEFAMSGDYSGYTLWQGGADNPEMNLAILPKRVCATIVDDGTLTIFVPSDGTVHRVQDKDIETGMALGNWGDRVLYLKAGAVWSVRMK